MTNKNIIRAIVMCTIILMLTSCGNKEEQSSKASTGFSINEFKIDNKTLKDSKIWNDSENESTANKPEIKAGEINIDSTDSTIKFSNDGNDIIYNGVRYIDLSSIANQISIPCDKNTFINFIVKTFTSRSTVTLRYKQDSSNSSSELNSNNEEDTYVSIDSALSDSDNYLKIKAAYNNEPVTWSILITDENYNKVYLYGCKYYIMYGGSNEELSVDMSKYNYTISGTDTSNSTISGTDTSNSTISGTDTSNSTISGTDTSCVDASK